ncbi:MAG TPA: GDSL-type esterase/lipase family protein [Capsulimonadaceae bacterium]|jgi:lysophospholipase L1-like esterase
MFESHATPFREGDRVSFIGDSTTHSSSWHSFVRAYYATRLPQANLWFTNCGISGDSAEGAVARFADDILPSRPNVAVVMFGMNDVWRSCYEPHLPLDASNVARRAEAIDRFDAATRQLVSQFRDTGCSRITLVTPCPFDDEVVSEQPNLPGVNAALGLLSERTSAIANELGLGFINIHTPMTVIGRKMRQSDPTLTLNRIDRVHPMGVGMRIKAELFLAAQGIGDSSASVAIDAQMGVVTGAQSASVCELTRESRGLEFTMTMGTLPLPLDEDALEARALLPFTPPDCSDMLNVTGLGTGTFSLYEDDVLLGGFSGNELAAGVNLSSFAHAPRALQAAALADRVEADRALQCLLRDMRLTKIKILTRPDLDFSNPLAVQAEMDAILTASKERGDNTAFTEHVFEGFRRISPIEEQTLDEIRTGQDAINTAAEPRGHRYRIVPAP